MGSLTSHHRLVLLMHQGLRGESGKTGLGLLRYRSAQVVAVVDADCAGEDLAGITGIPCTAPIVDSVAAALVYAPQVLVPPPAGYYPQLGDKKFIWDWQRGYPWSMACIPLYSGIPN